MYYGQCRIDKHIYEKYFQNVSAGFFVECGSSDGISECTCKFFEETLGWTGINIEPSISSYKKLTKNRPNCRNLNIALSNNNNIKLFTHAQYIKTPEMTYGLGRLLKEGESFKTNSEWEYTTFSVQCKKFSDVFLEERQIDLFVLDVEGHEIEVIEGILEIKKDFYPKVFCIEVTQIDVNKLNSMLEPYYIIDERIRQDILYKRKY